MGDQEQNSTFTQKPGGGEWIESASLFRTAYTRHMETLDRLMTLKNEIVSLRQQWSHEDSYHNGSQA